MKIGEESQVSPTVQKSHTISGKITDGVSRMASHHRQIYVCSGYLLVSTRTAFIATSKTNELFIVYDLLLYIQYIQSPQARFCTDLPGSSIMIVHQCARGCLIDKCACPSFLRAILRQVGLLWCLLKLHCSTLPSDKSQVRLYHIWISVTSM